MRDYGRGDSSTYRKRGLRCQSPGGHSVSHVRRLEAGFGVETGASAGNSNYAVLPMIYFFTKLLLAPKADAARLSADASQGVN